MADRKQTLSEIARGKLCTQASAENISQILLRHAQDEIAIREWIRAHGLSTPACKGPSQFDGMDEAKVESLADGVEKLGLQDMSPAEKSRQLDIVTDIIFHAFNENATEHKDGDMLVLELPKEIHDHKGRERRISVTSRVDDPGHEEWVVNAFNQQREKDLRKRLHRLMDDMATHNLMRFGQPFQTFAQILHEEQVAAGLSSAAADGDKENRCPEVCEVKYAHHDPVALAGGCVLDNVKTLETRMRMADAWWKLNTMNRLDKQKQHGVMQSSGIAV